jgi:peptidoglycan-N-acetylglucosamine deacetylase
MKKFYCFLISCLVLFLAQAQTDSSWKGRLCAVVLTYDDALDVQLTNAVPLLDSLKLKASFYLSGYSSSLRNHMEAWRSVAKKGHELGNHTLYHPCAGNLPGREFVTPDYDLSHYSVRRMQDEIRMTNTLLAAMDGKKERTFAYPCGDTKINDTAYYPGIAKEFIGARGVQFQFSHCSQVDLDNIPCFTVNGQTGDALIDLVKQAMKNRSLIVFLFHGVGGGHGLNVSLEAHRKLLVFLQQHPKEIWTDTMISISKYIQSCQATGKTTTLKK